MIYLSIWIPLFAQLIKCIKGASELYVGKSSLCISDCDGSLLKPFPNFFKAMEVIDKSNIFMSEYSDEVKLIIIQNKPLTEFSQDYDPLIDFPTIFNVFSLKRSVNLSISCINDRANIVFENIFISIAISKGSIKFENINFNGKPSTDDLAFIESGKKNSLLTISGEGNVNISFINCKFIQKFYFPSAGFSYANLIAYEIPEKLSVPGSETSVLVVIMRSVEFIDTYFPLGMIISNTKERMLQIEQKLYMSNISMINYHSTVENDTLNRYKLNDFCIAVNSAVFIEINNIKLINSTRFLIAMADNRIQISNASINSLIIGNRRPELFFFRDNNNITFSDIIFKDYYIENRDDLKNKDPDSLIIDSFYQVVGLADDERIQSSIKICFNNIFEIVGLVLENMYISKRSNMYLAFFCAEYKNIIKIENSFFKNITIDSSSSFGVTLIYLFLEVNVISFKNLKMTNLTANTFSVALSFCFISENTVSMENISLQYLNFKHKAKQVDIVSFYNLVGLFGDSGNKLFSMRSEEIKVSCFSVVLHKNSIKLKKAEIYDVFCLGSCFLNGFVYNLVDMDELYFRKIEAELISGSLLFQIQNTIVLNNSLFENGKAVAGVIFSYFDNQLTIDQCNFKGNIAVSIIGKTVDQNLAISGVVYLGYKNILTIISSQFSEGQCDIYGGSITLNQYNDMKIFYSVFQNIQSTNRNAKGGVFMAFDLNNITLVKTNFINNLGYYGGVIYTASKNVILVNVCKFSSNFALVGSILYLEKINYVSINNSSLNDNEASDTGLFHLKLERNVFIVKNSELKRNKAKVRDCLILIEKSCNFTMKNVLVDYDNSGLSSFIWSLRRNTLYITNCSFFDAGDLFSMIILNNLCDLIIEDTIFSKVDSFHIEVHINNYVIIKNSIFKNSKPYIQNSGLSYVETSNSLIFSFCNFSYISGNFGAAIKMVSQNYVMLNSCYFSNFTSEYAGGLFQIDEKNTFEIVASNFRTFEGFNINSIFLRLYDYNNITINSSAFTGSVTPIKKDSSYFLIAGEKNNIYFYHDIFKLKKNGTIPERLEFLSVFYTENFIYVYNNSFTLFNFSKGISIFDSNSFKLVKSRVVQSIITRSFFEFILMETVDFILNTFSSNLILDKGSYFIIVLRTFKISLKNIKVNKFQRLLKVYDTDLQINESSFSNSLIKLNTPSEIYFLDSLVKITKTTFTRMINQGCCNFLVFATNISLTDNKFLLNQGGLFHLYFCDDVSFVKNNFILNIAPFGAVFFSEDSYIIKVFKNIFFNNRATANFFNGERLKESGKGGCFYIREMPDFNLSTFTITFNEFRGNSAEIGGVYFIEGAKLVWQIGTRFREESNKYKNNFVVYYGDVIATSVYKIQAIGYENQKEETNIEINFKEKLKISNYSQSCYLKIYAVDRFGQVIKGLNVSNFSILLFYKNQYSVEIVSRDIYLCFNNIKHLHREKKFIFVLDHVYSLALTTKTIFPNYNENSILLQQNITLYFKMEYCGQGEYLDSERMQCLICEPNFFSFAQNIYRPSTCLKCENYNFYCYGGNNLSPKRGYWRLDAVSTNFFKCPNRIACLGDINMIDSSYNQIIGENFQVTSPVGTCALGYRGALCNTCAKGYAKSDEKTCRPCGDVLTLLSYLFQNAAIILVFSFMIYKAISLCKSLKLKNADKNLILSNFLIKILIGHFQFVRLIMIIFTIDYADVLLDSIYFITRIITTGPTLATSIDCLGIKLNFPARYLRTILLVLLPIISAFLLRYCNVATVKGVCTWLKFRKKSMTFKRGRSNFIINLIRLDSSAISIIGICLMLFFDQIMLDLLSYFPQINLGDMNHPDIRLLSDFEIKSNEAHLENWRNFFVIPFIIIYLIVTPLTIFYKIFKYKRLEALDKPRTLFRYGYFYFAYDKRFYFYELIYVARKSILILIDVLCARLFELEKSFNDPITFLTVLMVLFMTSAGFSKIYKPFNNMTYKILNDLEFTSFIVQALTCSFCCLSLSLRAEQEEFDSELRRILRLLCLIAGAVINIYFILLWFYHYWAVQAKPLIIAVWYFLKNRLFNKGNKANRKGVNKVAIYKIEIKEPNSSGSSPIQQITNNSPSEIKIFKEIDQLQILIKLLNKENLQLKKQLHALETELEELKCHEIKRNYSVTNEETFSQIIRLSKKNKNSEREERESAVIGSSRNIGNSPDAYNLGNIQLELATSKVVSGAAFQPIYLSKKLYKAELFGNSSKNYFLRVFYRLTEDIFKIKAKIRKIEYSSNNSPSLVFKGEKLIEGKKQSFFLRGSVLKNAGNPIEIKLNFLKRNDSVNSPSANEVQIFLKLSFLDFLKPISINAFNKVEILKQPYEQCLLRSYKNGALDWHEDLLKLRLKSKPRDSGGLWGYNLPSEDIEIFFLLRKFSNNNKDHDNALILKSSKKDHLVILFDIFNCILTGN